MKCIATWSAAALVAFATPVFAQTVPDGAPAAGSNVQYRYTTPGQSQQLLAPSTSGSTTVQNGGSATGGSGATVQGPANPYAEILERRGGAEGAEGEGGFREPFQSESVSGVGYQSARERATTWIDGADIYRGIIPNTQDTLPHVAVHQRRAARGANRLTWIGFQPFDDSTRVFLQTGRDADYRVAESPDGLTVTIRLSNTAIALSNFRRTIDASYFGRPVVSIDAMAAGGGATDVVIELDRDAGWEITEGAGVDGAYVFIDFDE